MFIYKLHPTKTTKFSYERDYIVPFFISSYRSPSLYSVIKQKRKQVLTDKTIVKNTFIIRNKDMIKWLVLFLILIGSVHTFEIFIKKPDDDQNIEGLKSFYNKTYEIPLFQTRFITIRIYPDDLQRTGRVSQHDVIGFKFQVKSTDIQVVEIRKEVRIPTNSNNSNHVLLEDLFICKLKYFSS